MVKKILHFLLSHCLPEHMDPEKPSIWTKQVWDDHLTRYQFITNKIKKGRLLDIASGEGYGSAFLADFTDHVVGVDLEEPAIQAAKQKYCPTHPNLTFIHQDALVYLGKNSHPFDTIVTFETIEHIAEYKKFLTLLKQNLVKSGVLIISTPNKFFSDYIAGDTFNPFHVKEFYPKELVKIVEDIFGTKSTLYLQRPVLKKQLIKGVLQHFFFQAKSTIVPNHEAYEGMDLLLIIQKK